MKCIDMNKTLIFTLLLFLSCAKESSEVFGYYATFIHNGIKYEYETGPESIITHVSKSGIMDNAINFYDGDSLHLTIITSMDLLGLNTINQVQTLLSENNFSLNPSAPVNSIYFAPFFHYSSNGGYLELDGNEFVIASVKSISDIFENCLDIEISFEVFANSGDGFSNYFQDGEVKTQICLN